MADDVHGASVSAPAVRTPEQEAGRIAEAFDFYDRGGHWEVAGDRLAEDSPYGPARVCRVVPARVLHVIGASAMAEQLRHLYSSGAVTGWALQPMPKTRTPLHTVKQAILQAADGLGRGFTQLTRGGFLHTEEVQACPALAMLGVDNIGPQHPQGHSLRPALHRPDPAEVAVEQADIRDGTTAVPRGAQVAGLFAPATRARYPRLVEQLAASRMPDAALAQIAEALNGELLPAADPMVDLLLDTAGLRRALEIYRATHRPAVAARSHGACARGQVMPTFGWNRLNRRRGTPIGPVSGAVLDAVRHGRSR